MKGSVENSDFCTSDALHMHQRTDAPHHLPQQEKDMTTLKRFILDDKLNVLDTLNPTEPMGFLLHGEPQDEIHLREIILWQRLIKPVDDLIINLQPEETDSWGNKPYNEEAHAIRGAIHRAIYIAIWASQLNTLDPAMSVQNRFDGEFKREKIGLQEFTSLSLFRDDVERILRDLYGNIDSEALERTLHSVLRIAEEFTRFVRRDLWQEHQDAMDWDYIWGIGVPDGYPIYRSDQELGHSAYCNLQQRARTVRENPSAYSRYTVASANEIYDEKYVEPEPDIEAMEPIPF